MESFVNSVQLGREKTNYTTVIELTAGTYEEEGASQLQAKVPVRFEIYPTEVSYYVFCTFLSDHLGEAL